VSARTAQGRPSTPSRGATRQTSQKVVGCVDVASAASVDDGADSSLLLMVAVDPVVVADGWPPVQETCCSRLWLHGTKELHLRVRTCVTARDARLNVRVVLQVSLLTGVT